MNPLILPDGTPPSPAQIDEATALLKGGLGRAEIEFVASVTAPLFWVLRDGSGQTAKNGSVFFLDAGDGVFGVTAAHVVEQCFADSRLPTFVQSAIGGNERAIPIYLGDRIIDACSDLDIATFRVTPEEIAQLGRTTLAGYQKQWPPQLPEIDRGVTYCGFPGNGRKFFAEKGISFGIVTASGIATSVNDISISILIERQNLMPVLGEGVIPENYDFGGISGGPLIAIVQTPTLRSWMPAGVIFQGPNPTGDCSQAIAGFDVLKDRPVQYILPDGHLDLPRWKMNNPNRR